MVQVLAVVSVVVVGLMVGAELSVAVFLHPVLERLPRGGLAARSEGARVMGRVMPFWYAVSVVLAAGRAAATWGQPAAGLVAAAAALLALSVVMSVLLLVPINSRVAAWSTGAPAQDWRRQLRRWDRLHYLRVVVIGTAFVLLVTATT